VGELSPEIEAAIGLGYIGRQQAEREYGYAPRDSKANGFDPAADALIMDISSTLAMQLPAIEQLCGALYSSGVLMIAGVAGVGKSLYTLALAAHLAAGKTFGGWHTPKPRGVLYVDGEMASQYMQARLKDLPGSDKLGLIHLESMRAAGAYINLGEQRWRDWFLRDEVFGRYDVFIFDTVSSLLLPTPEISSFAPEYWLQLEAWHQQFRAHGKTVVWVDNLNKAGEIFGTALKQHKVDSVWHFEAWKECSMLHTAAFTMQQGKLRGDSTAAGGNWYYHPAEGWKIDVVLGT